MSSMKTIKLFADEDFKGEERAFLCAGPYRDIQSVDAIKCSSIVVESGTWILYEEKDYMGKTYVLTKGQYPNPGKWTGGRDTISCLRCVADDTLTLFEHSNFNGRACTLTGQAPNLTRVRFNDKASSAIVTGKFTWQVCEDEDYGGRKWDLAPGSYPDPAGMGGHDILSSARPCQENPGIQLFEHGGFQGERVSCGHTGALVEVGWLGGDFNNKCSSIEIHKGTWVVYEHMNFRGKAHVLKPGAYSDCTKWGGEEDTITSVRGVPENALVLFGDADYSSYSALPLVESHGNFADLGFDDKASSAIVTGGDWEVFEDASYGGKQWKLSPGHYNNLATLGCNDKLSSAKRL
ncbi:AIM1L [Branchiostoma lanceolatum]|uniref:AIM1L protein n=1 Tax=Branchiostoma lanceolatum TaxID=7740 RepID=A0A8J9ZE73_BRALA|nr:AIM1L [Branchiostoma lanceolatum]